MQGDNIVSFTTWYYPHLSHSDSKFKVHITSFKKLFREISCMHTLHSPPFYPANLWHGHSKK